MYAVQLNRGLQFDVLLAKAVTRELPRSAVAISLV
jgi:hypothetical protein